MTKLDPKRPFNDLALLPPKATVETTRVLKKAISANRALARLRGSGSLLPSQEILLNPLLLEEARDSSAVENIVTTRDKLYIATAVASQADPQTKKVLRYREALWRGYGLVAQRKMITTNMILELQRIIVEHNAGIRKVPGTVVYDVLARRIVYTPPEGESLIRDLLGNLEKYLNEADETDPLVKMAVAHYQFEAIHPFSDGNGRTGRILNVLYLILSDFLELPVLYLSTYVIAHKQQYYELLRGVTNSQKWEDWILFMLDAVEETSREAISKIKGITVLLDDTMEKVRRQLPAVYSKELIELVFRQPYTKVKLLVDEGLAERKTVAKYLDELARIGVLRKRTVGRENVYLNSGLYDLFAKGTKRKE